MSFFKIIQTVTSAFLVSIAITPIAPSIIKGELQQFIAIGTFNNSTTQDITNDVIWSSSALDKATISNAAGSKGLATSLQVGVTNISAFYNGITAPNATLTIKSPPLQSLTITPAAPSIVITTVQSFIATATLADNSTHDVTHFVTWSSSNEAIATISNASGTKGDATGVAAGTTTITAQLLGVSTNTALTVTNLTIGDLIGGGVVACLKGGINDLIAATVDNSNSIVWGDMNTKTKD